MYVRTTDILYYGKHLDFLITILSYNRTIANLGIFQLSKFAWFQDFICVAAWQKGP